MLLRVKAKIRENKGSSYLFVIILIFAVFLSIDFVNWADKDLYTYWVNKCEWGIESGTKAAMIMLENTQNNIKNIGDGFFTKNSAKESYNNDIKIEHLKSMEVFFEFFLKKIH